MAHVDVSMRVVDDIKFFNVENVRVDFTIGRLTLRLNNLYNGLKALGRDEHRAQKRGPVVRKLPVEI
jgi:hypothetical protein